MTKEERLKKLEEEYQKVWNSDLPFEEMKSKLDSISLAKMLVKGALKELNEEMEDIDEYDDLMTMEHWIDCVKIGGFIDYDGWGYLATDKQKSNIRIFPSSYDENQNRIIYVSLEFDEPRFLSKDIDLSRFTHVAWCNR